MNSIHHIATSFNGPRIALAESVKNVQIYDIAYRRVFSEFETILDFGGRRLSISEDGLTCVTGCWERYGICGYSVETGDVKWQRRDLVKVQRMHILRTNANLLFAQFEIGSSRILDLESGRDIRKVKGVKGYFQSQFQQIDIFDRTARIQLLERESARVRANIDRQSFATLDISFSPDSVLISESGGPLSCYDTDKGKLKWRMPVDEDGHFLRLSYNKNLKAFLGVSWPFTFGGNKKLKYLNLDTGVVEREKMIDCPAETEFGFDGNILVTSNRELIDIETCETTEFSPA